LFQNGDQRNGFDPTRRRMKTSVRLQWSSTLRFPVAGSVGWSWGEVYAQKNHKRV